MRYLGKFSLVEKIDVKLALDLSMLTVNSLKKLTQSNDKIDVEFIKSSL